MMKKSCAVARTSWLVVGVAAVTLAACKNDKPRDTPATLAKLADCTGQLGKLADKDKLISSYEAEIARLKLASEGGTTYTFVLEGDAWAAKGKPTGGGGTGGGPPLDDAKAKELASEFIALVGKARPPVQKCYEQALKKNAALQARTVTLKVSAQFAANGSFTRASFSPNLGDAFETCMRAVAGKWKLTPAGSSSAFQATVTLSPS